MAVNVQQITGIAQPVIQLLANRRYGLDFYQREYSWEDAQVGELIDDLARRFLDEFDPSHERTSVKSYRSYFLGPIVTAQRGDISYLVDGQQRITTLNLLLMCVRHLLNEDFRDDAVALNSLIFSTQFGRKTFNIDVDERKRCMDAIFEGNEFDPSDKPESVRNLWDRYQTIVEQFPSDLQGDTLPYFADWLQHRVVLVDISTPDQDMALEIFETMNDRGLRLSNTDMLKSYLLARVGDEEVIRDLNDSWRRRVTDLGDAEKNADAEFVKAWLRGNYAQSQRERKANATPEDFDIIGTAFHKWVRDNADAIGLKSESDYRRFVEVEFFELSKRYLQLLRASDELQTGLEAVYYNARTGFTLQIPVILAAITPDDDDATFEQKAALVAGALDIYVVRRMVNYRNFGYSTVVYTMFNLIKEIRNQPVGEIRPVLADWLAREHEQLDGIRTYSLTQRNRRYIRYILARMTAWLDSELGTSGTFTDYLDRSKRYPFEVEHIWADKFDRHTDEFSNSFEFQEQRNKLGDLVLLPKDFNASYGDMPYEKKVEHYYAQNPLAQSLHPRAYENNPSFRRLRETHALAFQAYPDSFTKADIESRQELYLDLAKVIWNPTRLDLIT